MESFALYLAIGCTIAFIAKLGIMLVGVDSEVEMDAHSGSLFSINTLLAFGMSFGWLYLAFTSQGYGTATASAFSAVVSFMFSGIFGLILVKMRAADSGEITELGAKIGDKCEVYLKIPSKEDGGYGQVKISIRGSMRHINAFSKTSEISTGSFVVVTSVINDSVFVENL